MIHARNLSVLLLTLAVLAVEAPVSIALKMVAMHMA